MDRIPAFLLLPVVLWMLSGCVRDNGDTVAGNSQSGSTPFADVILENLRPVTDATHTFEASDAFFSHLELLGNLTFADSVVIGTITLVRARDDGTLLLIDLFASDAFLFSPDGRLLRMLEPTECDPGAGWRIMDAAFLETGELIVHNGMAPYILRFDEDGLCDTVIARGTGGRDMIAPGLDGTFVSMNGDTDEYWFSMYDRDGQELNRFGHSDAFFNLLRTYRGSTCMTVRPDGAIVVGLPPFSAPVVFGPDGSSEGRLFDPPSYVRAMHEDIPLIRGDVERLNREFMRVMSEHSTIIDVYSVLESSTMVVYRNGFRSRGHVEEFGIVVVDKNGRSLLNGDLTYGYERDARSRFHPYLAKDNLVFTIMPAEELPDGDWGNPGLDVWRFTPAAGD